MLRRFLLIALLWLASAPAFSQFNNCGHGICPNSLFGRGVSSSGGVSTPSWALAGYNITCSPADSTSSCYVAGTGLVAYSSLFTVSRASQETVDCNGVVTYAANNTIAVSCNGIQSTYESRTNLMLRSGSLTTSPWATASVTVAVPTLTANAVTAPDGTLTATQIVYPAVSGAGAVSVIDQSYTATTPSYSLSLYAKGAVGGESLYLMTTPNGSLYRRLQITLTTSWQRFCLTGANDAEAWFYQIGTDLRDAGQAATSAQTIYAWGAQVELGDDCSPLIPTTSAAVTRPADNVTATGALDTLLGGSTGSAYFVSGAGIAGIASTLIAANGTILLSKDATNHGATAVGAALASTNIGAWGQAGNTLSLAWNGSGGNITLNGISTTDAQARTPSTAFKMFSTGGSSAFWNAPITKAAFATTKTSPAAQNFNIVGVGDSITQGTGVTSPWPTLLAAYLGTSQNNQGTASIGWNYNPSGVLATSPTLLTQESGSVCPLVSSLATGAGAPTIFLFAGTNDIFYGATAAATYSSFQTYLAALVACGQPANKIVAVTMLPGSGRSNVTRASYNSSLVSGAVAGGYLLARMDLDPLIGCDTCNTNTTYFNVDQVHPKDAGETIEINILCLAAQMPVCPVY